jgi:hypothetical protein
LVSLIHRTEFVFCTFVAILITTIAVQEPG